MAISCRNCPLRDHAIFEPMTESEIEYMQEFKTGELEVQPGTLLMMEGSNSPQLFTPLEGMGLRYKTLEGGERQVINFVMPGDFIGLQAGVMSEMQHSVEATTAMRLCVFNRQAVWSLFRDHPARAYDLTWVAAVEEHLLGENLAILGQMGGIERVARALLRLYDRARAMKMTKGREMPLPYKQQDLADALGLSLVHTNKTLKTLRGQGVIEWKKGVLKVLDYEKLCEVAEVGSDRTPMTRPLI